MSSPDPKSKGHSALISAKNWLDKDKYNFKTFRAASSIREAEFIVKKLVELCEWQETMLRDTLAELGQEYPHE